MLTDEIQHVRRFNRTVTQRIGALSDNYLSRQRPLGASRLLWEIEPDGSDARSLRTRLDLDSGYLSRLLRMLENEGLVTVEPHADDQRVRLVRLTDAGRAERAEIDRRSDELAHSLLSPLDARSQQRLVEAMATVERLLTAGLVDVRIVEPSSEDAEFCIRSYFAELDKRFDNGFDLEISKSADVTEFVEPTGLLLVAYLHDEPIGCGALRFYGAEGTDVKRMWVADSRRGLGVGRRILSELERHARQRGIALLRLETNHNLTEAISLYQSAGYVEVDAFNSEPYAHHWFAKDLTTFRLPVR